MGKKISWICFKLKDPFTLISHGIEILAERAYRFDSRPRETNVVLPSTTGKKIPDIIQYVILTKAAFKESDNISPQGTHSHDLFDRRHKEAKSEAQKIRI